MSKAKRVNKAAEKVRNLSPEELKHQEREQMDQLFRLKFQMKMGQSESLTKIRALRRNVARLKTLRRQYELGIHGPATTTQKATSPKAETQAKVTAKKTSSKKTAGKKSTVKAGKK
jgi:large subunit ribosomal protein L29